ncbi:Regulator of chromosome condensation-like protein, partial [Dinothrombium tinctorium]
TESSDKEELANGQKKLQNDGIKHEIDLISKCCVMKNATNTCAEIEATFSCPSTDSSDYDDEEDSEFEESLVCNVCDRSFKTPRLLGQHQLRRRHFGCSVCDALFPNLLDLQHHKESLEHWSDNDRVDSEYSDNSDEECFPSQRCDEFERLL